MLLYRFNILSNVATFGKWQRKARFFHPEHERPQALGMLLNEMQAQMRAC